MDINNRGSQQSNNVSRVNGVNGVDYSPKPHLGSEGKNSNMKDRFFRASQAVLFVAVSIVLIGLLVFLIYGNKSDSQSKYINTNDLQAVFLNTGQVYFGNIKDINSSYFNLVNIFYLQSNTSSSTSSTSNSASNVTLVKLGCELHAPLDQMIINTREVTFWENLSPNGQVSKAVAAFWKQNPNGQKCSDQTTAGTSGSNTPQNATNKTSSSTPAVKP
jgi:hypothetical protein